jgi:phosphoribosyl 1,2-cyclic phosphate phosphodiesterase
MIVFNMRRRLPVWADGPTQNDLLHRFGYAFVQPEGSAYPAILDLHAIDGDVTIEGDGGPIIFHPFEVTHGSIDALGFRIGDLAYLPDVSDIPEAAWPLLEGPRLLGARRAAPHAASQPRAS